MQNMTDRELLIEVLKEVREIKDAVIPQRTQLLNKAVACAKEGLEIAERIRDQIAAQVDADNTQK